MPIAQASTGVSLHRRPAHTHAGLWATGFLLFVVGAVGGCGDRGALNPGRASTAEIHFNVSAPMYVKTLAITVTGPGIDTPLIFNFPIDSGNATGSMAIPAGSRRRIVALAFDSLGVNTHGADTTVTVTGGTSSLTIILWPIIGDIPVVITTGAYSVILTPGDTTLPAGDSLRFQAVVRDPGAALVANATPVWASTNPSVVSVDNGGLAHALVPGSARIVASYRGAAASRAFNVTAGAAAKLAFSVQPSNVAAGASISPAVQVAVQDAQGNTVTSATTSITLAIGNNPASGTLSGTATVAAVSGVATFSDLSLDKAGTGYTLTAAATGLSGATSSAFTVLGFSNASLSGTYSYSQFHFSATETQSNTPAQGSPLPVPRGLGSEFGTITFDGAGNATLSLIRNQDGTTSAETASFTYSVATDGALTFGGVGGTARVLAGGSVFVFASTGDEMNVTVGIKKSGTFTNASLSGSYSFVNFTFGLQTAQSNTPAPGSPLPVPKGFRSGFGTFTFDGAGNVTVSGTVNQDGTATTKPDHGTYSVATDGTFTFGGGETGSLLADGSVYIIASTSGDPMAGVGIKKGGTFTNASLSGSYSFVAFMFGLQTAQSNTPAQGSPLPVPKGFQSTFGTFTFDGAGNVSQSTTENRDGTTTMGTDHGTYSVATDGTITFGGGITGSLLADGRVLVIASTSGDPVFAVGIKR